MVTRFRRTTPSWGREAAFGRRSSPTDFAIRGASSFDRQTGDIWLGDVGQYDYEEVDVIQAGDNLGWRVYEGFHEFLNPFGLPPTDFTEPVHEYGDALGNSVIGGYVYRGPTLTSITGMYVYGDNGSGSVWVLAHDNFDVLSSTEVASVPGPVLLR